MEVTKIMRCQNSHMVKLVVFNAFHIIGSRLWTLWRISLKIYEYVQVWYFLKLLVHVVISDIMFSFTIFFKSILLIDLRAPNTIHFYLYISLFLHDLSILLKKYGCHDLIPNPCMYVYIYIYTDSFHLKYSYFR